MNKQHTRQQIFSVTRQLFLQSFFDEKQGYEEKEVNGFWLIRQFSNEQNKWQVAIYTRVAYLKRKTHEARIKHLIVARRNSASEVK